MYKVKYKEINFKHINYVTFGIINAWCKQHCKDIVTVHSDPGKEYNEQYFYLIMLMICRFLKKWT